MSTLITIVSLVAVAVGIFGIVPQLVVMARTRSANGQSVLGWALGASANLSLFFVNGVGNHNAVLSTGNFTSFTLCVVAVGLVRRFAATHRPAAIGQPVLEAVAEMHTHEFVALRDVIVSERQRRGRALA